MAVHFTCLLIFANPFRTEKRRLDYYAEWYVYPYFTQHWNLFVPPPSTNYNLFVQYEDEGTKQLDLFQEILGKHQSNRFKGYGPLLLTFINSIHYFEKNTELQKPLNGPVTQDLYFKMLEESALHYLKATRKKEIKKIKMILVVNEILSAPAKVYYN